jgi:hypothetical protein
MKRNFLNIIQEDRKYQLLLYKLCLKKKMHLPDKLLLLPYMFQPNHILQPKHDKQFLQQLTHLKGRQQLILYMFLVDHKYRQMLGILFLLK